jgi:cytoskeletal protein RodZ
MKKKLIAILLLASMLISGVACAGEGETTTAPSEGTSAPAPDNTTAEAPEATTEEATTAAPETTEPAPETTVPAPETTEPPVSSDTGDTAVIFAAIAMISLAGVAVVAKRREN